MTSDPPFLTPPLDRRTGVPFKLSSQLAAANDGELKDLQAKIANGEITPEAPCDGMYSEWSAEEKSRLKGVLADVFGWDRWSAPSAKRQRARSAGPFCFSGGMRLRETPRTPAAHSHRLR